MNTQSDKGKDEIDQKKKESIFSSAISFFILVILVFAFKSSILDANNIPSGSMIPTLKIGDYLFVNKMRYSIRFPFTNFELLRYDNPSRGDIITFIPPGEKSKHYVKRVMGIPGDRIRFRNVPACELYRIAGLEAKHSNRRNENGVNAEINFSIMAADRIEAIDSGKGYRCNSLDEPNVALFEYKERDAGSWQNANPLPLSDKITRQILTDSDNVRVLHPDLDPLKIGRGNLPVLFRERINNITHYIVETSEMHYFGDKFCEDINDAGCIIPDGQYLVMGDNRDDSKDSRMIGLIKREMILGKAFLIYFSINWHDNICNHFPKSDRNGNFPTGRGFLLPEFPPSMQKKYCSTLDDQTDTENTFTLIKRTFLYRIPRMYVRWDRLLKLLE